MKKVQIKAIHIYPIKSMGAIDLMQSNVCLEGLMYDRRYALLDENNVLLTQRANPEMSKFELGFIENGFEVKFENKKCVIPFEIQSGEYVVFYVWDDEVEGILANDEINDWFSQNMGFSCKLVFQPNISFRKIEPDYSVTTTETTSLADGYPILMISEASLTYLNDNLDSSVSMKRFRPNIVVSGLFAFEEECIRKFEINDAAFYGIKPCARCKMVTLNSEKLNYEKEPLKTLAKLNLQNNKVIFGQNVLVHRTGIISVGDSIILFD